MKKTCDRCRALIESQGEALNMACLVPASRKQILSGTQTKQ